MGRFALLWLNVRVRWRERRTGETDGVFLQQMRAVMAADVIRPRSAQKLRLIHSNPPLPQTPSGAVRHQVDFDALIRQRTGS